MSRGLLTALLAEDDEVESTLGFRLKAAGCGKAVEDMKRTATGVVVDERKD